MIKDAQVRKLRQFLGEGHPLYRAALKVGMDAKSARKYRHADRLPSESFAPRTWRTREDPFQDVWPQLRDLLESIPGSKPRPSSRIFSVASQADFPTSSSAPCSGRSKRGEPLRVQPRRSFSIKSIGPASWLPPTSRT